MIVEVFINEAGVLCVGDSKKGYISTGFYTTREDLKIYEVQLSENEAQSKGYIKNIVKLKEAGFTADEIMELLGRN